MCITKVSTPAIGSNLTLSQARDLAKKHEGNEVIVKDKSGEYSVHELKPNDTDRVIKNKGSDFDPKAVEFSINKGDGSDATVINHNAKFTDKARSEILTIKENSIELGHKISDKVTNSKESIIDNTEKLFDKIKSKNGKDNKYVKGGEKLDIGTGVSQVDCSGFVLNLFKKAGMPLSDKDTTAEGIGNIIRGGKGPLKQTTKAKDIKPTDVITFEIPKSAEKWYSGHVMIATGNPEPIIRNGKTVGYNVDIIDSTSKPHSNDDRNKAKSGTGSGTISFGVDAAGNIQNMHWGKNLTMKKYELNVTVGTMK